MVLTLSQGLFQFPPSASEEVQKKLVESTARTAELAKGIFHTMECLAQYRNWEVVQERPATAGGLAGQQYGGFIPLFSLLFITIIIIISDFISFTKLSLSQPMGFTFIFFP